MKKKEFLLILFTSVLFSITSITYAKSTFGSIEKITESINEVYVKNCIILLKKDLHAKTALDSKAKENAKNDSAFFVKNGFDLIDKGAIDKSIDSFKKAIKIDPHNIEAMHGLAFLYLLKVDSKAFDETLQLIKRENNTDSYLRLLQGSLNFLRTLGKHESDYSFEFGSLNPFADSIKYFRQYVKKHPNAFEALMLLAKAYNNRTAYKQDAIKTYEEILKIEPNAFIPHYELFFLYSQQNNIERVQYHTERLRKIHPSLPAFVQGQIKKNSLKITKQAQLSNPILQTKTGVKD